MNSILEVIAASVSGRLNRVYKTPPSVTKADFHIYGTKGIRDRILRWEDGFMPKSTQVSQIFLLTEKLAAQEKRPEALEKQVAALGVRSAIFDGDDYTEFGHTGHGYYGDDDSDPVEPEPVVPRLGRKPRIKPEDYVQRRDILVQFIELRWPYLVDHFSKRASTKKLLTAWKNASPGADATWPYRHLTEHVATLKAFIRSGRYQDEPRQIAYAMAGLPEWAWRTSFDYGTKHPSPLHINLAAFLHHIRRHNPKCFQKLNGEGVTTESLRMLRICCPECHRLAAKPERVRNALRASNQIG